MQKKCENEIEKIFKFFLVSPLDGEAAVDDIHQVEEIQTANRKKMEKRKGFKILKNGF